MKKAAAILLLSGLCFEAADFWQSKPFSEWSTQDAQKILNNSPWARSISVSMSGPTPPTVGGPTSGPVSDVGAPAPISENGGGRGGRGGAGRPGAEQPTFAAPQANVVVRWQSALPVKEALAREKYGSEAATSPEARQFLETAEPAYVIVVSGPLRPFLRGNPDALKKDALTESSLQSKGKNALKPTDIQFGAVQKAVEIYFYFPKSAGYSLEDKEVEFSTRFGDLPVKSKFRLKDMVFNGKLEM